MEDLYSPTLVKKFGEVFATLNTISGPQNNPFPQPISNKAHSSHYFDCRETRICHSQICHTDSFELEANEDQQM